MSEAVAQLADRPDAMNETAQMLPSDVQPSLDLLLNYQKTSLVEMRSHQLYVMEKSRRIGFTWGDMALDAVLTASAAKDAGGDDYSYICYDKEITREFIDACAMWAKAMSIAAGEIGDEVFVDEDADGNTREIKAFRIDFASGFKIVALPSVPRSIRGRKGVIGIDEAAFITNLAQILKAALALLVWGGRVAIASSHNGTESPFNLLLDDIKAGRRKGGWGRVTFADAMADGLYERYCLVNRKEPTPEGKIEYEREIRDIYGADAEEELDCIPSQGGGSYIPPELVVAAQSDEAGKPELYTGGLCFGGRDIAAGRGGDLAVMWVFELLGIVLWLRERVEDRKMSLTAQEVRFNLLMTLYRIIRFGLDQTGMGEGEVERAIIAHGERVQGFILSPPVRLAAASAMLKRFQDGTIRIPADPRIRADFRAIKKVKGDGAIVRLVNDGEVHADLFWACALACLVADGGVVEIDFKSSGNTQTTLNRYAGGEGDQVTDKGWGTINGGFDLGGFQQ